MTSMPWTSAVGTSRNSARAFLVLTLFSLPFCGVGVFMAASALLALGRGEPVGESVIARVGIGVTFGTAGFGLLALSRWGAARAAEAEALRARHPEEPWRWHPEWASGRVPARGGATAVFVAGIALLWCALCAPLVWQLPDEIQRGNGEAAVGLLFPAVGLGLLVWAARGVRRWRRFGRCVFEMDTRPGVIGGPVRGTVHVPAELRPRDGVVVTLACVRRITTGHGKSRHTSEHVRWSEERTVPPTQVMSAPVGSAFTVDFRVPGHLPSSSPEAGDDVNVWRLETRADVPGVDFHARFELPVFVTEASDPSLGADERPAVPALSSTPVPVAPGSPVTATAVPGGVEIHLPPARNPGAAALLTVVALFWNGFVAFMATGMAAPLPFVAVFFLGGLLILAGALDAWLGSLRIRARRGELAITRRFLGIGRTRVVAVEPGSLSVAVNGHVGNRVLHALKGRKAGAAKDSTLASGLGDHDQAERLLAILRRAVSGEG